MDIIKWRKSYETGVTAMDEQHHKLISLINQLYKVMRSDRAQTSVSEVLGEMTAYADLHFHEEEKLLKKKSYPEFDSHVALHQNYREKMEVFTKESEEGEGAQVQAMYTFLRKWWMEHIIAEDKLYGEHLSSEKTDQC